MFPNCLVNFWTMVTGFYMNSVLPFFENYVSPTVNEYIIPRVKLVYNVAYITFIDWLGVTGIYSTTQGNIKWVVYTYMGKRYRFPIRKTRGPSGDKSSQLLKERFAHIHDEILGPFGDYHGQEQVLADLAQID